MYGCILSLEDLQVSLHIGSTGIFNRAVLYATKPYQDVNFLYQHLPLAAYLDAKHF